MKGFTKSRLYFRIMLSSLCIGLLPVLLFCGYILVFTKLIAHKNVSEHLTSCVNRGVLSFESLIAENVSQAEAFGSDAEVASILGGGELSEQDQRLLYKKMYALNSGREKKPIVCVTDIGGGPIAAVGIFPDDMGKWATHHASLLSIIGGNGKPSFYSPCYYSISNGTEVTVSIASRILVDDVLYGYVFIDLSTDVLHQTLLQADGFQTDKGVVSISYLIYTSYNYVVYNEFFTNFSNGTNILDLDFRDSFKTAAPVSHSYTYNGAELLMVGMQDHDGFVTVGVVPIGLVTENNAYILWAMVFLCLVSVAICAVFAALLTRSLTRPVYQILDVMRLVERGDLSARVRSNRKDEIGKLAAGLDTMVEEVDRLFKRDIEKQRRLFLAELYNLQSQIRPHFLYNVLDSVKWLAKLGATEEISEVVTRLGDILKRCVNTREEMETVEESIAFVDSYLAIQRIIYPDKLSVSIEADPQVLSERIPRFLLQPIVENSVLHGIEPKIGRGTVSLRAFRQDERLLFVVKDDGVGIDVLEQVSCLFPGLGEHGNGLYNIDRRIKLHYGNEYGLTVESQRGHGTTVTVAIPYRQERGDRHAQSDRGGRCDADPEGSDYDYKLGEKRL